MVVECTSQPAVDSEVALQGPTDLTAQCTTGQCLKQIILPTTRLARAEGRAASPAAAAGTWPAESRDWKLFFSWQTIDASYWLRNAGHLHGCYHVKPLIYSVLARFVELATSHSRAAGAKQQTRLDRTLVISSRWSSRRRKSCQSI